MSVAVAERALDPRTMDQQDSMSDTASETGSEIDQQEASDDVQVQSAHPCSACRELLNYTQTLDPAGVRPSSDPGQFGPAEDARRKIFKSILHQITVQRKPIYRCQMPIFVLETRSLTEKLTDFFAFSRLLYPLNTEASPEKRLLGILRFYLAAWHLQIPTQRSPGGPRVKNPLNPVLGEVYRASFGTGDERMDILCEQITHHPPSSAFAAWNVAHKVSMEAYIRPDSHFAGNQVDTYLVGELVGHLYGWNNERYVCTYPKYVVKGILFNTMQMELGGKTTISCDNTGYMAEIEFKSGGQFSNDISTVVTGKVWHTSDKKKILHTINGNWDSVIKITTDKVDSVFLDVSKLHEAAKYLPAPEQQMKNESRQIWGRVAAEILARDEESALQHKTEIEELQRSLLAERKKNNITWVPKYFEIFGETWRFPLLRDIFNIPERDAPSPAPEKSEKERNWFKKTFTNAK